MSDMSYGLEDLLHPVELTAFFDNNWGKQPLVLSRQGPEHYANLFSLFDVDTILASTDLRYPALRLVKNGTVLPIHTYTRDVSWGNEVISATIDMDRVLFEYGQGATIVLQAVHRYWPSLAALCRNMERHLNCPVQTNVYLTPRNAQGFAPHYDTHDVFVLQTAGSKHWLVYDSPVILPDRTQPYNSSQTQPGEVLHELDLSVGGLIYIPRGFIHEALTSDTESLHITVGIISYTWVDVFEKLVSACRSDPRFRASLPVGFAEQSDLGESLRGRFAELMGLFSAGANLDDAVGRIADRFVSTRSPLLNQPISRFDKSSNVELTTVVRRPADLLYRFKADADFVTLLFRGKQMRFPKRIEQALAFAFSHSSYVVEDIPGGLDDQGKLVLTRRLVREGFITLAKE